LIRKTIELSGDRVIATGRTMAKAEEPPKPGNAPRKIPKAMPMADHIKESMVRDARISNMVCPSR
jgi:hypothetical protein